MSTWKNRSTRKLKSDLLSISRFLVNGSIFKELDAQQSVVGLLPARIKSGIKPLLKGALHEWI